MAGGHGHTPPPTPGHTAALNYESSHFSSQNFSFSNLSLTIKVTGFWGCQKQTMFFFAFRMAKISL